MTSLLEQLPPVRGRYTPNADLKKYVWFQVGGPAEVLFKPKDVDDLCDFFKQKPSHVPVTILGVGSNVLIRDGGIPGVTIKLGSGFSDIKITDHTLEAGAGALDRTVALTAAENGLGGFSFLAGIPGTMGGAVKMNAGAYGHEIKDIFQSCQIVTTNGTVQEMNDVALTYRNSSLPEGSIVVKATFKGTPQEPDLLYREIEKIMAERELSQPVKSRTGGSTFKNPPSKKAWELIDQAGCRGHRIGDAMVSEKHCNFLINTGQATAADLELLGDYVQKQVLHTSGIPLEWEIRRLGIKKGEDHA
jgi:UDP-N-acetylmuramate dehydrogenase